MRANVEAMVGNFGGARALTQMRDRRLEELGQRLWLAAFGSRPARSSCSPAIPKRRRAKGISGLPGAQAIGERGWLSTVAGQTAHALLELGRDDEAEHWIGVAAASGSPDDVITRTLTLEVEAKLCSRRGDHAEAAALARAAVALIAQTDMLEATADARLTLAGVLHATGDDAEAVEQIEEAVELYERKRHLVGAARARSLLASARSPA